MGSHTPHRGADPPGTISTRDLVASGLRVLGILAAALVGYALVPVEGARGDRIAIGAAVALVLILIVFVRQYSRISRAGHPFVAAVEALAIVFGLFLSLFALMYVAISDGDPAAFTQPITKIAGFYFATTVLATVGFGDIAAASDAARVVVTVQMVVGMVLIGAAVKGLAFSAKQAVESRGRASVTARIVGGLPPAGDGSAAGDQGA
ncbi:MAG: ion channel [Candidatus Nanopelagicales bacterium]